MAVETKGIEDLYYGWKAGRQSDKWFHERYGVDERSEQSVPSQTEEVVASEVSTEVQGYDARREARMSRMTKAWEKRHGDYPSSVDIFEA